MLVMMSTINHTYNRSAAADKQDRWSECFACSGNSFSEDDVAQVRYNLTHY